MLLDLISPCMFRHSITDDKFAGFDLASRSRWDADAGQSDPISDGREYAQTRLRHVFLPRRR